MASCDDVHIFFASYTSKYQNSSLALSSVGSQVFSDLLVSTAAVPGWSALGSLYPPISLAQRLNQNARCWVIHMLVPLSG